MRQESFSQLRFFGWDGGFCGLRGWWRRGYGRLGAGGPVRFALWERPPADRPETDPSVLLHEDERAFRVHGGDDEPEMAGVAGEPTIADAAHGVPLLHRGVSALDAAADARGPGIEKPLPIFERVMDRPRHATPSIRPRRASVSRNAWPL